MGTESHTQKIDLVVMTGTVPFITAGIFQEDETDATLISGALSGMSNMLQELFKQGELRHSELHNAHVYIRHLSQMNDVNNLINPEIKHNAQMRIAIVVRQGELSREQELALSELCYSIMVKICEQPKLAKKLIKGNAEGYIPTYHETLEILADAIIDYRKRARKSVFYEKPNFLQEKERFAALPTNDSVLEDQIKNFALWLEEEYYPDFFPKLSFEHFFGKKEYWLNIKKLRKTLKENLKKKKYVDQVSAALIQYVLQSGLMPLVRYSGDILKRINSFSKKELPQVFEEFIENLMSVRGPLGISLRAINKIIPKLNLDDCKKVGWHFLQNFLLEINNRPFEQTYLKQMCRILEQFELHEKFVHVVNDSFNEIVPQEYIHAFVKIINANLSKPVDLTKLLAEEKQTDSKQPIKKPAPSIPKSVSISKGKKQKSTSKKEDEKALVLPKATPESTQLKNKALLYATSRTFSWIHNFLFGKLELIKKNIPHLSNDGLFFYYLSESLTIEIGLIIDLIQAFSGPRTWLCGQLDRIIDNVESKLKLLGKVDYEPEKKMTIDVKHVPSDIRKKAEQIIAIINQIETEAKKGRITKDNIKSYLESGFLGRAQENSIPNTKKLLNDIKSIDKNLTIKELNEISKATGVNFDGLTTKITSMQLLAIPLPEKESAYPKLIRELISCFKKWNVDINDAISTIFRVNFEITDPANPQMHDNIMPSYLRSTICEAISEKIAISANSDFELKKLIETSFTFKKEIFKLIGDNLLLNRPLKVFTTIPLTKTEEEKFYVFNFAPIKPPILTDEIEKFYLVSKEDGQPSIIGRFYTYIPFEKEQINNLTELLVSDAFRRAYDCVEPGMKIITKMIKKYHSGIVNLHEQINHTYKLLCNQLSITKTTN
jgi:hypothetical protein